MNELDSFDFDDEFDDDIDDLNDFDLPDGGETGGAIETTNNFIRVKKYARPKTVKYDNAEKMVREIGVPAKNECVFAIVSGNFIAGDLLEAFLVKNNLFADELIIATLSLSQENVDSLRNIQEYGLVDKMGLVVSDYFFSHERQAGIPYIIDKLGDGYFDLAAAGIHTKIALIKTSNGQKFVFSGSANLRSSRNIEQITIDNNDELYDFNRAWIVSIFNKYRVSGKSLRAGELWQLVAQEVEKADTTHKKQKPQ